MASSGPGAGMPVSEAKVYGGLVDKREAERLERLAVGLSEQAPPWAAQYIQKAAPVAGVLGAMAEVLGPAMYRFYTGLYACYQQLPTNAASCIWGFGLCFYGGRFPLSLAAIEAFKLTGGSEMLLHVNALKEAADRVQEANAEDNEKDEDADGTKEVDQLPPQQLVSRKMGLLLRVIDPGEVTEALRGLWSGYMGVLAALRMKYARTTALAHSIGESARPAAAKLLGPTMLSLTPPEYHKWVNPALNFTCKIMAATLAWKLQSVVSTVQSGFAGGLLASRSALALLVRQGLVSGADTMLDEVLGWSLAASGIYFQLMKGGAPPLILAPVAWPLGVLERSLRLCVSVAGGAAQ